MEIKYLFYILLGSMSLALASCSESFIPDTAANAQQYVVEGFVEAGDSSALPAFVLLTRSIPFLDRIDQETFSSLFVSNAFVEISDGSNAVRLTEICLENLPAEIKEEALNLLGLDAENTLDFCIYVDALDELDRSIGNTYQLTIDADGEVITASTTMPSAVPLSDFNWSADPGLAFDSLARLRCFINDPPNETNYYRYKTAANGGGLLAPFFSVIDDAVFDGEAFEFPLEKAENLNDTIDFNTAGLFTRGDTIVVKWMTLDEAHFNFWNTLEFNRANQGPFASYTRVSSNVEGALGVFGAYTVNSYQLVVPR